MTKSDFIGSLTSGQAAQITGVLPSALPFVVVDASRRAALKAVRLHVHNTSSENVITSATHIGIESALDSTG